MQQVRLIDVLEREYPDVWKHPVWEVRVESPADLLSDVVVIVRITYGRDKAERTKEYYLYLQGG